MNIDLAGKAGRVTGASRGIGESIARRRGETGAHVLCAARSAAAVERVASEIVAAGGKATGVALDIAAAGVREGVRALLAQHGNIDILVNNAGATDDDLFLRMKAEAWTKVMHTNLDSAFHITQQIVKNMIRPRWVRIINYSSIVCLSRYPGQVNYSPSQQ